MAQLRKSPTYGAHLLYLLSCTQTHHRSNTIQTGTLHRLRLVQLRPRLPLLLDLPPRF